MISSIINSRSLWPTISDFLGVNDVPRNLQPAAAQSQNQLTGLAQLWEIRFSGDNQTKDTRRPQGVACYDGTIITSWYFRQSVNDGNAKLTITDVITGMTKDVCPVQLQSGKFIHIDSHAGGLGVVGDYLYIADSNTSSLRVFDLRCFFYREDNLDAVNSADSFANIYDYLLPEVGRIILNPPDGAPISYMSTNNSDFVVGNFYDPTNPAYSAGGKSMIWEMPFVFGVDEFAVPDMPLQHEPTYLFGSSVGQPITRIQGALITPNRTLILNRSWSTQTKSLIVWSLISPNQYFCGTHALPQVHHETNWLYGCEGLAFTELGEVLTVTEFINNRNLTCFSREDIENLVANDLTIAEHELLYNEKALLVNNMYDELEYYRDQIDYAVQLELTHFDAATFFPEGQ